MLVLLFIFMANTRAPYHGRQALTVLTAVHSTPCRRRLKEDAMRIFITRDGDVYFGNHASCDGRLAG